MGLDAEFEPTTSGSLEFAAPHGRVVSLLRDNDSTELFDFLQKNSESFAEFAPQLTVVQSAAQALQMLQNRQFATFGIKSPQEKLAAIGTVMQIDNRIAELGFAVGADYRRQGYAADLVKTLSANLFKTPDINKIRCFVHPGNRKSRLLLVKCGFHLQGEIPHKGVFYDLDKAD